MEGEQKPGSETISGLSQLCIDLLDRNLGSSALPGSSITKLQVSSLEDARARFKVWVSNIGALQLSRSSRSLDFRLRHAPLMRDSVLSGLRRLISTSRRALHIIDGVSENRSISQEKLNAGLLGVHTTTELTELLLSISSSITHLFSLSILIRRQRPKGRLPPVIADYKPVDQSPDISYVMDKFPDTKKLPWLAIRLGNAIIQRRQFIHYRQLHRQQLAQDRDREAPGECHPEADSATIQASTIATTFKDGDGNWEEEALKRRMSTLTAATSFLSMEENGNPGRHIPDLSDMVLDGVQLEYNQEFECPYCRTVQKVSNRQEWKKHVFADLQPYSCTFADCDNSHKLFATRSEWLDHETSVHRRQWSCNLCSDRTFKSAIDLDNHFAAEHYNIVTEAQRHMLVLACERPIKAFDKTSCPLCRDWEPLTHGDNSKHFSRHLARHMQQLALVSLPLAIEGLEVRSQDDESEENEFKSDTSESLVSSKTDREVPSNQQTSAPLSALSGDYQPQSIPISARVIHYRFAKDKYWFVIEAYYDDGRQWELHRYYEDFYDLQITLLSRFPDEAGTGDTKQKRILPYCPGPVNYVTDKITEGRVDSLNTYLTGLFQLADYIAKSDILVAFFSPRDGDFEMET